MLKKSIEKQTPKAAIAFLFGGAIGVTASGCSSLQTPRTKTQTSAIYALEILAIIVTYDTIKPPTTPAATLTRRCRVTSRGLVSEYRG